MPAGEPRPPDAPLQPEAVGREGGPFDSVWPSPSQELLLDAALARGDRALAAWRAWADEGRLDRTDRVSRRLLPFVYGNLTAQGLDDPLLGRLREFYLATWKRAQDLLRGLERALRVLNAAGIETLLLKGAALAPFYYDDEGVRWLGDLDVLVPERVFVRATGVLERAGWTAYPSPVLPAYLDTRFTHAVLLHDDRGRGVDLHCHILDMSWERGADDTFWAASVPVTVRGVPTRTLCATDHLLHLSVHGFIWVDPPPIGWVVDAMTVLRKSEGIDWARLIGVARERRAGLFAAAPLRYLVRRFGAAIPSEVLTELDAIPASRYARREYELLTRRPRMSPVWLAQMHWIRLVRGADEGAPARALALAPAYLRFWAQAHGVGIPWNLTTRWARIAGRHLRSFRRSRM